GSHSGRADYGPFPAEVQVTESQCEAQQEQSDEFARQATVGLAIWVKLITPVLVSQQGLVMSVGLGDGPIRLTFGVNLGVGVQHS
ncbi:MAG TPA: hypothetical protein VII29_14095, partial [Terriglobales bacterium]